MEVMEIEPVIRERWCGGWLATTPDDANIRFGVVAEDREAVLTAFREAEARWMESAARAGVRYVRPDG